MTRYFPVVDLRNRNGVEILLKANRVFLRMTANPRFPNPNPGLVVFKAAIENLKKALSLYDGSKLTLQARKMAEIELASLYRLMASYVNNIANGDPEIICSSGYDLNKKKSKVYINEEPVLKRYIKMGLTGHVKIRWNPIPRTSRYTVYLYAAEQPDVVIAKYPSAKASFIFRELESGKRYIVRVQARCRRSQSPLSVGQVIYEVW